MRVREHITAEVLLDFAEDRLDTGAVAHVRNHLATGCKLCTDELAFWNRMLPRLQAERSSPTPQPVLHKAFALFASIDRKPALLERVLAVLVFDSRQQILAAGARDVQHSSFKLLFETPDTRIDLLCERESELWAVAGQVLTQKSPEMGWKIALQGESGVFRANTDRFGEFQLQDLQPGRYELSLQDGRQEIAVTLLSL